MPELRTYNETILLSGDWESDLPILASYAIKEVDIPWRDLVQSANWIAEGIHFSDIDYDKSLEFMAQEIYEKATIMSELIYKHIYHSINEHLASIVDKLMIEDAKKGFQHGSGATYDICRALVDNFIMFTQRDKEVITDLLYQHYCSNYLGLETLTQPTTTSKEQ